MNIHYFLNTAPIGKDNKANPNLPITEDANFPNLNGATSRFAATYPGEHIKNQGNNVSYYYIGKETSTENLRKIANQISKNDICFFIKNQDINCQKMMQLAKEKGAKCGVHVPDPHIINPDENFTEKKDILRQMSKEADFNVASSEELKKLITQELDLIPKTVHVVFDSIDTKYALPNFEIKKYFKIGTTGYPHTHEPTFNYLNALKTELSHEEKIEFNFVTAGQRTDQVHHKAQNVLEKIEELNADNFTIKILPYSTQNVLKTVEEIDIWLIANNSSLLKGHKKEGQKYKSIGRAAAGLYAGKPVVCEEIIPSYSLFKNKGIYTLQPSELISFFKKQSPKKVNEEIKKGQKIAQQLGSPERTAKLYLDIFKQYQK